MPNLDKPQEQEPVTLVRGTEADFETFFALDQKLASFFKKVV